METCSLVVYQIYHPLWGKVGIAVYVYSVFVQCTQYNTMYIIYTQCMSIKVIVRSHVLAMENGNWK